MCLNSWMYAQPRIDRWKFNTCCPYYLLAGAKFSLTSECIEGEADSLCGRACGEWLPCCCAMRGKVLNAVKCMRGGIKHGGLQVGLLVRLAYHNSFHILGHRDFSRKFPRRQRVNLCGDKVTCNVWLCNILDNPVAQS